MSWAFAAPELRQQSQRDGVPATSVPPTVGSLESPKCPESPPGWGPWSALVGVPCTQPMIWEERTEGT